jgi:hypothetical protein
MGIFWASRLPTRRKTTLPDPPRHSEMRGLANIAAAMKSMYIEPIREQMNRQVFGSVFTVDPWDEAIQWIEQRHADREEWPWPKWRPTP